MSANKHAMYPLAATCADPLPTLSQCPSPLSVKDTAIATQSSESELHESSLSHPIPHDPHPLSQRENSRIRAKECACAERSKRRIQDRWTGWPTNCPGWPGSVQVWTMQVAHPRKLLDLRNQDNWSSRKGGNLGGKGGLPGRNGAQKRRGQYVQKYQMEEHQWHVLMKCHVWGMEGGKGTLKKVGRGWLLESNVLDLTT